MNSESLSLLDPLYLGGTTGRAAGACGSGAGTFWVVRVHVGLE